MEPSEGATDAAGDYGSVRPRPRRGAPEGRGPATYSVGAASVKSTVLGRRTTVVFDSDAEAEDVPSWHVQREMAGLFSDDKKQVRRVGTLPPEREVDEAKEGEGTEDAPDGRLSLPQTDASLRQRKNGGTGSQFRFKGEEEEEEEDSDMENIPEGLEITIAEAAPVIASESAPQPPPEQVVAEPPASPAKTRPKREKKLEGEDHTAYILGLRCFIHPFATVAAQKEASLMKVSSLTEGESFTTARPLRKMGTQSKSVSAEEMRMIRNRIRTAAYMAEDDSGQDVYYASLRHFSQRMRKDWAGIMSKGRNETGFLVKTFTEVARVEMLREFHTIDPDMLRACVAAFEDDILRIKPAQPLQSRSELPGEDAALDWIEDDLRLAAAFGLSEAQHTMMCELEQAVNTDANVADELRRRLAALDYHPYYTRQAFVQKTAAWLKWKEVERDRIQLMLKSLGESSTDLAKVTATTPVKAPAETLLKVRVARAKDLVPREGSLRPSSSADTRARVFCVVEYEGDRLRTFTAPYVYDPEWPEQEFSFKVADKDSLGPLKVFLYAEGATVNRDKDKELGHGSVDLSSTGTSKQDHWCALYRGKAWSHLTGEVLVSAWLSEKGATRVVSAASDGSETVDQAAEAIAASLPDYHHLFDVLFEKVTSHAIAESGTLNEETVNWVRSLSFEFGLRYGVGQIYRILSALTRLVEQYRRDNVDIQLIKPFLEDVGRVTSGATGEIRWTRDELQKFQATMDELVGLLSQRLRLYTDFFPFSTPPGELSAYVDSLYLIFENDIYRLNNPEHTTAESVLRQCVQQCCHTHFLRWLTLTTPMNAARTPADIESQISKLVQHLLREIEENAYYFKDDFRRERRREAGDSKDAGDHDRHQLDVAALAASCYSQLLNDEIREILGPADKFSPELMRAYFKLQKFNRRAGALVSEAGEEFTAIPLMTLFHGMVEDWLLLAAEKTRKWSATALKAEKWNPVEVGKGLHSSSVVDVFWMLNEIIIFLYNLEWEDENQLRHFTEQYAEILVSTVRTFLMAASQAIQRQLADAKSGGKTLYIPSRQICVLLCNMEVLMSYTCRIAKYMGYPKVLLRKHGHQRRESAAHRTLMTMETVASVSGKAGAKTGQLRPHSPLVSEELANLLRTEDTVYQASARQLAIQITAPLVGTLRRVAEEESLVTRSFSLLGLRADKGRSQTVAEQVYDMMGASLQHLDEVMELLSSALYSDSFTLVLEGMWEEILTATRTTLLTKAYGGADGLLRLNEALLLLWDWLHADGDGLDQQVAADSALTVYTQAIQLLALDDVEGLCNLHQDLKLTGDARQAVAFLEELLLTLKSPAAAGYIRENNLAPQEDETSFAVAARRASSSLMAMVGRRGEQA